MLKLDYETGTLQDEAGTVVDLKNVFGWAVLYGGPIGVDQFRIYAEQAYREAAAIPHNQRCPDIEAIWSQLGKAPLIKWYQQWLESPWTLTSSSGRKYTYSQKDGLRSV